jgi:Protein of unknown function (DUF3467)
MVAANCDQNVSFYSVCSFEDHMTKQLDELSLDADSPPDQTASGDRQGSSSPAPAQRSEVQVDDGGAILCYANFCRVTGTPEELILDFGLNSQPMGAPTKVDIKQRLVVNYFTAKRILHALGLSIQRHEMAFGVLETDVQKRVSPALRRSAPAG